MDGDLPIRPIGAEEDIVVVDLLHWRLLSIPLARSRKPLGSREGWLLISDEVSVMHYLYY